MNKCCCNRKTCHHSAGNDDSSQNSASWEGVDISTQMSPNPDVSPISSDKNELSAPLNADNRDNQKSSHPELSSASAGKTVLPAKTTKKSSQTHFNRNNENINSHQNKLYPSNTSQISQLDSTLSSDMIKYPMMAATTTNSPHLCMKCRSMQMAKSMQQTTTTSSSLQMSPNTHKCTCQNMATSSSSQCTIPENFPIQLKLNFKPMEKISEPNIRQYNPQIKSPGQQQIILVPKILPRPERLQPYPSVTSQAFLTPNSLTCTDDYYSCTSEESECDMNRDAEIPFKIPGKLPESFKGAEKNLVILQLLHEVVHLIQENDPIQEEAMRIIQEDPTSRGHITTQTKETVCVPLNQSETSKTQSSAKTISRTAVEERSSKRNHKEQPDGDFNPGQLQPPPKLTWPKLTPCYCYLHGMAAAQNRAIPIPYPIGIAQEQTIPLTIPVDSTAPLPHNFVSPFPCIAEIPQDFICQATEVACDECSCDENEQITLIKPETDGQTKLGFQRDKESKHEQKNEDVVKCICPKLTDICPKHGPLENLLKESSPSHPQAEIFELKTSVAEKDQAICTCPTEEDKCPVHSRKIKQKVDDTEEDVDEELYPRSVKNTTYDSSKNNSKDIEHSKPIRLSQENEVAHHAKKTANNSFDISVRNPNHDQENNEKQVITVEDKVLSKQPRAVVEDQINQITVYYDETTVHHELSQIDQVVESIEKSPYIVRTSTTTGRNIYNFLPALDRGEIEEQHKQVGSYELAELDSADDYYYPDYECEEFDEECELAKEKNAERRKKKKRDKSYDVKKVPPKPIENINIAIATLQQLEGEGSPEEMKFFIDSLILDLDAMEQARRKTAIEKNLCMPRPGMCHRESFPATITDVTDLGTTSLYVKWIIHDCCGIGGYEIYTDGYLTNRYFHCKHEAAVITNVDVTLCHKIALVAQTATDDASIELMCNRAKNKNSCKCLPWKPDLEKDKKSSPSIISTLWTPSIYLYDPATCRATAAPPVMRGSI